VASPAAEAEMGMLAAGLIPAGNAPDGTALYYTPEGHGPYDVSGNPIDLRAVGFVFGPNGEMMTPDGLPVVDDAGNPIIMPEYADPTAAGGSHPDDSNSDDEGTVHTIVSRESDVSGSHTRTRTHSGSDTGSGTGTGTGTESGSETGAETFTDVGGGELCISDHARSVAPFTSRSPLLPPHLPWAPRSGRPVTAGVFRVAAVRQRSRSRRGGAHQERPAHPVPRQRAPQRQPGSRHGRHRARLPDSQAAGCWRRRGQRQQVSRWQRRRAQRGRQRQRLGQRGVSGGAGAPRHCHHHARSPRGRWWRRR